MLILAALATAIAAGCADKRIERGIFRSPKGYHIAVPADGWMVTSDSRADLELRRRNDRLGMLVNAACATDAVRATLPILERHLLAGLRERKVMTEEDVTLAGRPARHAVLEGRYRDEREPVRIELYVMRDGRCVYDFLYVAPPASFAAGQPEFERFVNTFSME
jgi:hypothetical protein